jgi:hypothetical protein
LVLSAVFLIILSIIDLKTFNTEKGGIPSFLTSAFLVLMAVTFYPESIILGSLGLLLAIFFVDVGLFKGLPDLKVLIGIAMTLPSLSYVLAYSVLMLLLGAVLQLAVLKLTKISKDKGEIPYIPIMTLAYFIIMGYTLAGGLV